MSSLSTLSQQVGYRPYVKQLFFLCHVSFFHTQSAGRIPPVCKATVLPLPVLPFLHIVSLQASVLCVNKLFSCLFFLFLKARRLHLVIRRFHLVVRRFHLVVRRFHLVVRRFHLVVRRFHLVVRRFHLVVRRFYLVVRRFHLVVRRFHLVVRRFHLVVRRFRLVVRRFDPVVRRSAGRSSFVWRERKKKLFCLMPHSHSVSQSDLMVKALCR